MAEPKYGTLRSNKSRVLSSLILDENKPTPAESEVNKNLAKLNSIELNFY